MGRSKGSKQGIRTSDDARTSLGKLTPVDVTALGGFYTLVIDTATDRFVERVVIQ